MMKCVIIDDEVRSCKLLRNMLADLPIPVEVLASCEDLVTGVKAIKKTNPNIVFLDIEMPGQSGLELLDYFKEDEVDFNIIFTTGYSEYAIQAFQLSAIGYLLKPINIEQLEFYVEKCASKMLKNTSDLQGLSPIQPNMDLSEKCILVNLSASTHFVKVRDVVMLRAEGSYCRIYLTNGAQLLASKSLKHFEEKLLQFPFYYRSHKSYLVNLYHVQEFNKSGATLHLKNDFTAAISNDRYDLFLNKMEYLV